MFELDVLQLERLKRHLERTTPRITSQSMDD
jgi:hypothetical protein